MVETLVKQDDIQTLVHNSPVGFLTSCAASGNGISGCLKYPTQIHWGIAEERLMSKTHRLAQSHFSKEE